MSAARRSCAPALALALLVAAAPGCGRRKDAATPEQMKAKIAALGAAAEARRPPGEGPPSAGMPETGVRVGVPTPLVRTMIERLVTGFVDSVTLRLSNLK